MPSLNLTTAASLFLLLLSSFGYYSTWKLAENTGVFTIIQGIGNKHPQLLPGTDVPLRDLTGLTSLDQFINILTVAFWSLLDGKNPAFSSQAVHFAGQAGAIWILTLIEGSRRGNWWRVTSFTTIWGILVQTIAAAIAYPIWTAIHLFTSPCTLSPQARSPIDSATNLFVPPSYLRTLPLTVLLGFAIPTVLTALPSPRIIDHQIHQLFLAIWQAWPIWMGLLQFILPALIDLVLPPKKAFVSAAARNAASLRWLNINYAFALAIATISHLAPLTLSITTLLFPSIFAEGIAAALHPALIFLPPSPLKTSSTSLSRGMQALFQWDEITMCAAAMLWSAVLEHNSSGWQVGKLLASTLVTGPAGAAVLAIWGRDRAVLGGGDELLTKKLL